MGCPMCTCCLFLHHQAAPVRSPPRLRRRLPPCKPRFITTAIRRPCTPSRPSHRPHSLPRGPRARHRCNCNKLQTASHITPHVSHLTPHISHLTPHTSHLTPHTSHLTPHITPRPTRYKQHITHHVTNLQLTPHDLLYTTS